MRVGLSDSGRLDGGADFIAAVQPQGFRDSGLWTVLTSLPEPRVGAGPLEILRLQLLSASHTESFFQVPGSVLARTPGDPKYHSGRKKKEYASPYLEFLAKLTTNARRMPQFYEFDPEHADGIRHADLMEGERVLNEVIYDCQRSLEGIGHARLDLEARSWAGGMGLRE